MESLVPTSDGMFSFLPIDVSALPSAPWQPLHLARKSGAALTLGSAGFFPPLGSTLAPVSAASPVSAAPSVSATSPVPGAASASVVSASVSACAAPPVSAGAVTSGAFGSGGGASLVSGAGPSLAT